MASETDKRLAELPSKLERAFGDAGGRGFRVTGKPSAARLFRGRRRSKCNPFGAREKWGFWR